MALTAQSNSDEFCSVGELQTQAVERRTPAVYQLSTYICAVIIMKAFRNLSAPLWTKEHQI